MRSVSVADAKTSDLAKANKYIRKLKSENVSLQFLNLEIKSNVVYYVSAMLHLPI